MTRLVGKPPSWRALFGWALFLRVAAADLVQWYADRKQVLCLFPDATIYWGLAAKLVKGEPFEVTFWGDLTHFALRTPGYPGFLAACQAAFGERPLAARLTQAALGAACVGLVAGLVKRALPGAAPVGGWPLAVVAAALTAFDPFVVSNSAFLLSEAVFLPLLLAGQWAFAGLWGAGRPRAVWGPALLAGGVSGLAILVRPSWALYPPLAVVVWVVAEGGVGRRARLAGALLVAVGLVAVMAPWWVRNAGVYGRFVPTALWAGASLYDGLSPGATGASDMSFLERPEFWPLDEETQDRVLRDRAFTFAREHPGRVAWLAALKAGRFWSPWPNAEGFRSPAVAVASTVLAGPVFALTAVGLWRSRRDARALALLALPLFYAFALHLVFVSSMRYRVPVFVPAFGLTALGVSAVRARPGVARVPSTEGDPRRCEADSG